MKRSAKDKVELRPDSWERFEKAVDVAMKTPAKHKPAPKRKRAAPKSKKG
jgi:hypothetical protein